MSAKTDVEIRLPGHRCLRCEHVWVSKPGRRVPGDERPRQCPKCKSALWDVAREAKR